MLFKYKPMSNDIDLIRIFDIINNKRMYMPKLDQLNDPFEGTGIELFDRGGYAGSSIPRNADIHDGIILDKKEKYRIMSLSAVFNSPQMWAYYCNDYNGICLGFVTDENFSGISKVVYSSNKEPRIYNPESNELEKLLADSLREKTVAWKHEKEYRIIRKDQEYFYYGDALKCIIIGHNLPEEKKEYIRQIVTSNIRLYITYPGVVTRKLHVLPYEFKVELDGSEPDFIDTIVDLEKDLANNKDSNYIV